MGNANTLKLMAVLSIALLSALFPAAYAEPGDSSVGGVEIVAADRGQALPGVTVTVYSNDEPVAEKKTNRTAMAFFHLQEGEYDVEINSNEKTLRDTIVVKPGEFSSFTADCAESSLEENNEPILNYRAIDGADMESDYRIHMAELDGLISVRMGTPEGTVYVSIPFYAVPGEKVSWSAKASPSGTTQEDLKKNERRLRDHELEIGGGYFPLTENPAATIIAAPNLEINLTEGKKKREKIRASVPFCSSVPVLIVPDSTIPDSIGTELGAAKTATTDPGKPTGEFSLSCNGINEATAGWPVRIPGVFDGLAENTEATVNGKPVQVEAETKSGVVISSPNWSTGLSDVQIREGSARAECTFRNVAIFLSADKLNLHSDETTTMHLKVQGLEKIKEPRYLALVNRSRSVISISGGNSQLITIHPSDVNEGGEYNQTRTLTGIRRGSFTIDAMLK